VVVKEVLEETGIEAEPVRLIVSSTGCASENRGFLFIHCSFSVARPVASFACIPSR